MDSADKAQPTFSATVRISAMEERCVTHVSTYGLRYRDSKYWERKFFKIIFLSYFFTALNPLSCEAYKLVNHVGQRVDIKIDIDGSGPLEPFPVTCQFHGMPSG